MQSRLITAAVLLTWAIAASGQASKSESAEADAAMERARRAAAGPLKAIQQAAKIRRRGEADAPPTPAAAVPAPAAVLAASSAVLPAAVATTERPAVDRVVAPPPALVLDDTPPALRVTEVAPLATPVAAAAVVALPVLAATRQVPDLPPAVPKLLNMLEPVIPPRLLLQEGGAVEVEVDMSLRADGTVESITVLPPVPRAWQRHITAALEQWRFEPMSGPAQHRVRLLFNSEPR